MHPSHFKIPPTCLTVNSWSQVSKGHSALSRNPLSLPTGIFIFSLCKMTLSHFFLLLELSTSPSFSLHSQTPFDTSCRKSESITRNSSVTAPAYLVFYLHSSSHALSFCLSHCEKCLCCCQRPPLTPWALDLIPLSCLKNLVPASVLKISPFLGRLIRTPTHSNILHLKQKFHLSHFTPIPYFHFPSKRNFWKEFITDGATFPTSHCIFIPPHTRQTVFPRSPIISTLAVRTAKSAFLVLTAPLRPNPRFNCPFSIYSWCLMSIWNVASLIQNSWFISLSNLFLSSILLLS